MVSKISLHDTIMDQYGYMNILKQNLLDSAENMGLGSNYRFQQNNNLKHTVSDVKLGLF